MTTSGGQDAGRAHTGQMGRAAPLTPGTQPSSPLPLPDQDARDVISTALGETLVVEAAAGTGKTSELVRRILQLLVTGVARIDQIVAVTFTERAAGELKLRLRRELELARHDAQHDAGRRGILEEALQTLEEAHISTIHGFCAELLRGRPVEAGIDPLFTVLTETQARHLYDDAFTEWFQEALRDPPEGVRRSLRRSARTGWTAAGANDAVESDEDGPIERLRGAGWALTEWRDFPASWTRPSFDRLAAVATLSARVQAFAAVTQRASSTRDALFVDTADARRAGDELGAHAAAADHDGAEAVLVDLSRERHFRRARKGSGTMFAPATTRADVLAAHQALVQELDAFKADADADLAALLHEELRATLARYERLKAERGALDFLDLLVRARDLVRDGDRVRLDVQEQFTHILVDEFQDTDPLQAEILLLLASGDPTVRDWTRAHPRPGKLFVVGDPKQSIYRFRRADVGTYQRVCEQLARQGARRVYLTTSFRSVPDVQRAVNAAFAPLMTGDGETLQARYVPLTPFRRRLAEQPSLVALPVPRPYGRRNVSVAAIDASLPDAVGAFLEWLLVESGWQVTDRGGSEAIPVQPRHICILFRRFVNYGVDVTRAYVDALEARGLAHLLVGGRAFHDREEIDCLRAALAAVEWPDDELSVFATLKGPFFAIGDEELLEYRHRHARAFHPFRIPETVPEHLAPIGDALRLLARLHSHRNRRAVAATITELFEATRAHVGFALRRAGEQVLANVLHVAELARQYELEGGLSFRGFVDALRDDARNGQAAEAPIVEEGSDGIRLMTVHKAKGLEFPVVILADMTAKLSPSEASRHIDAERGLCALRIGGWSPRDLLVRQELEQAREREEGIRVAYVAATRARDVLVVPVVGDQPYDGWVRPLNAAVYPALDRRRQAVQPVGCPSFRSDSVLVRPDDGPATEWTVRPGLHTMTDGGQEFEVVWWDPSALSLGAEPPFGLRRQELISKEVDPEVVALGQRRYVEWRRARDAALAQGSSPTLKVTTVTELVHRTVTPDVDGAAVSDRWDERAVPVEIAWLEQRPGRARGPRYGTLVHAALEAVPFDAERPAIERTVATQARMLAATDAEIGSAVDAIRAVFEHALLRLARDAERAGRCYREVPVTMLRADVLVEGVIDLAFEDQHGGLVVVDFKTDGAEGDTLAGYERQVAVYAAAASAATGRRVRAVLMMV